MISLGQVALKFNEFCAATPTECRAPNSNIILIFMKADIFLDISSGYKIPVMNL